jgi:hypothetical protein
MFLSLTRLLVNIALKRAESRFNLGTTGESVGDRATAYLLRQFLGIDIVSPYLPRWAIQRR